MIENEQVYVSYVADGVQREWEFPHSFVNPEDVALYIKHEGEMTKIESSQYVFNEETNKVTYPKDETADAVPSGDYVLVCRETPISQEEDSSNTNFKSNDIERIADKLTMIEQELADKLSRAIAYDPVQYHEVGTNAKDYIDLMAQYRDSAAANSADAANSKTQAAASASAASTSAQNAATSESNAASSATAASNSAAAAAASEQHTIQNEELLQEYVDQAEESANTAVSNATQAASSATSAAASAASASQDSASASTSATTASQAAVSASGSASAASVSASNAADSSSTATQKASEAASSATNAANSATAASSSETNAADSATAAAASATSIADSAAQIQQNKEDIAAIDAELEDTRDFVPPFDWVDIRSGALDNSVYYLVAHSVPTVENGVYTIANYPKWGIRADATTHTNTCDIYVDGIKVTTASYNTATIIDFPSLYSEGIVENGPITNDPSELVTHVIRVTPTVATDKIERINAANISGQVLQGVLWVHFETDNFIMIPSLLGDSNTTAQNRLCKAITAKNDELKVHITTRADDSSLAYLTMGLNNDPAYNILKHLPTLVGDNPDISTYAYLMCRRLTPAIKKLRLKNIQLDYSHLNGFRGEVIETDIPICMQTNPSVQDSFFGNTSGQLRKLKKLPLSTFDDSWRGFTRTGFVAMQMSSLEPTFLDFSSFNKQSTLRLEGTATYAPRGIKGVIVSSEAPFDYTSSPQINVAYTGLDRQALRRLFKSMPTVNANQVCNITGATGAADLTAEDLAIATDKGWTITR